MEHSKFVTAITPLTEGVFKGLDMTKEGYSAATTRSKKRRAQNCFEALYNMATDRIKTIEEDITIKVELHYQELVTLIKGVDLSGKNRQVV